MICDGILGFAQFLLAWAVLILTVWVQILAFKLLHPSWYRRYKIGDEEIRMLMGLVAFLTALLFFVLWSWYFDCW